MVISDGHVFLAARTMIGRAPVPIRDFISMFGVSPRVAATVWNITSFDNDIRLIHLLWALNFLKVYEKEAVLIGIAGGVDRKTYRDKIWRVLSSLKNKAKSVVCEA
jgi:hypothetical protein